MTVSSIAGSTLSYSTPKVKSGSASSYLANVPAATATDASGPASDTATVSTQAQVANAALTSKVSLTSLGIAGQGPAYSQSFFDTINSLRGQDQTDAYTSAAYEVSASQGLPPGQFDLHHMTTGQTMIAANYLLKTKQATPAEAGGMTSLIGYDWTSQTYDLQSTATGAASYESAAGNSAGAAGYQSAADMMGRLEALWKGQMQAKAVDDTNTLTSLIDASRSAVTA